MIFIAGNNCLQCIPDMVVVKRFFRGLLSSFLRDEMHDRVIQQRLKVAPSSHPQWSKKNRKIVQ